jgi:hypothetical protein
MICPSKYIDAHLVGRLRTTDDPFKVLVGEPWLLGYVALHVCQQTSQILQILQTELYLFLFTRIRQATMSQAR